MSDQLSNEMKIKPTKILLTALLLALASCTHTNNYAPSKGELSLAVESAIELPRTSHELALNVRAIFPDTGGPFPLIVLSHGTFSNNERYDLVAEYWASNGYTVLMPQHIDANYGVTPKDTADMVNIIATRVADMSQILDELDAIEQQAPALKGKIDRDTTISAGHSVGTLVAMRVTGLVINDINTQQVISSTEARFDSLIMLSDPGKMRQMPLTAWKGSTVPTFMSTGTDDYGLMGSRDAPQEGNKILSSDPSVDRYQLLLQEGDHYFGGLVQKKLGKVDAKPDYEGLEIFNKTSTAFLDAYAKNNKSARRYLQQVDLQTVTNSRAQLIREVAPD
jgi:hypothetical protein